MTAENPTAWEPTADEPAGYAEAIAELDAILIGLEDPAVDVDHLGDQVRRAAVLVAFCRQRIVAARLEVEQVTAALDDARSATDAEPGSTMP